MRPSIFILLALTGAAALAQDLTGTVKEERVPQPEEPNRQGLVMVKRALTFGPAAIRYQQVIDPKQGDKPVTQRYGDYILGLDFPRYSWNWDLQYFLTVIVTRPGVPPVDTTRSMLQEGSYVLAQGQRVMVDMVWPLPAAPGRPAAQMAARLIAFSDEPRWLYLRASVEGDPEAKISEVRFGSYPTTTTGPPERQRWVSSLTRSLQMSNSLQTLQPAKEWALLLHNRMAQEFEGTQLVVDPREAKTGAAMGTYGMEIRLQTEPLRDFHAALGYFRDTPWQKALDELRQSAPERLKKLQAVDWKAPVDLARWERLTGEIGELLKLTPAAQTEFEPEWSAVQTRAGEALRRLADNPEDAQAARSVVLLSRQAEDLKARLYEPALQALVAQATR